MKERIDEFSASDHTIGRCIDFHHRPEFFLLPHRLAALHFSIGFIICMPSISGRAHGVAILKRYSGELQYISCLNKKPMVLYVFWKSAKAVQNRLKVCSLNRWLYLEDVEKLVIQGAAEGANKEIGKRHRASVSAGIYFFCSSWSQGTFILSAEADHEEGE